MPQSFTNYNRWQEEFCDACMQFDEYVIEYQKKYEYNDNDMLALLEEEVKQYKYQLVGDD